MIRFHGCVQKVKMKKNMFSRAQTSATKQGKTIKERTREIGVNRFTE
jgi:hypothetical protein